MSLFYRPENSVAADFIPFYWKGDYHLFYLRDWRDPFVYRDERRDAFGMLLAGRKTTGPGRYRGCTALATSSDLRTWSVREPFWAPDEYFTHECPDLFRIGKWRYLVYSTFTEHCVTHYRMSRSLNGPWLAPANDTFDGRAFYAGKTAGNGRSRFIFGWLPTRHEEKDDGWWQWGGELVVHELTQQPNGALTVKPPKTVLAPLTKRQPVQPVSVLGAWKTGARQFSANAMGRHSILSLGTLPDECLVEVDVALEKGTAAGGILFRADETFDTYYQLRLEPTNRRCVVDRWPRPGDQPFMLERPLTMKAGEPIRLSVVVSGTCLVAYVNDAVALSCRMYDHRAGRLGLFVTEGNARFSRVSVRTQRQVQ